jgi:glutathione S-transferase
LIIRELGDKPYLLGDEFSAADLLLMYDLMTAGFINAKMEPVLKAYYDRLAARESFKKVFPIE